jgi:hypothetical protein
LTGEKNRYKTHEQLWKLEDGELSTPQHDELVFHLLNEDNIIKLIKCLDIATYDCDTYFTTKENLINGVKQDIRNKCTRYEKVSDEQISKIEDDIESFVNEHLNINLNNVYSMFETLGSLPAISDIKSEVPITSGYNNFIIGYIDIQFKIKTLDIKTVEPIETRYKLNYMKSKYEYDEMCRCKVIPNEKITHDGTLKGSGTLCRYISGHSTYNGCNLRDSINEFKIINVEVKPKIKSFGETLRQINTYRETSPNATYIIYTPDVRFKAAFETQWVKLITPFELGIK